jgi:hypothetical protein
MGLRPTARVISLREKRQKRVIICPPGQLITRKTPKMRNHLTAGQLITRKMAKTRNHLPTWTPHYAKNGKNA